MKLIIHPYNKFIYSHNAMNFYVICNYLLIKQKDIFIKKTKRHKLPMTQSLNFIN